MAKVNRGKLNSSTGPAKVKQTNPATQKKDASKKDPAKSKDSFDKKAFNATLHHYARIGEKLSDSYKDGTTLIYDPTTGAFIEAKNPEEAEKIKKDINYNKRQMLKLSDGGRGSERKSSLKYADLNPEDLAREMREADHLVELQADGLSKNQLEQLKTLPGGESQGISRAIQKRESLVSAIKALNPSAGVDASMSGEELRRVLDDANKGKGKEKVAPPKLKAPKTKEAETITINLDEAPEAKGIDKAKAGESGRLRDSRDNKEIGKKA